MNKKVIYSLISISVLLIFRTSAQSNFQRLIGGNQHERAQTIFCTYDSAYLVNGVTTSFGAGNADALTLKLDAQGQILWNFTYGTVNYDNTEFAIQTYDHNIVYAGRSNVQPGSTSAIIFKLDSAGNILWSKVYGLNADDGFVSLIETFDHGYAAIGNIPAAILFVKTDSNGDTLFTRTYDDAGVEYGSYIIQLPDSGFLISGKQQISIGGNLQSDGMLLRTDPLGNILWSKIYGDSLWEEFTSVQAASDGGFIVTGSTVSFGAGDFDIILMKTDSAGDIQWTKTFGGVHSDAGYDIHVNQDSSYVISGYTESLGYGHRAGDSTNVFLLKTNSTGDLQWMEVYGDGLQDEAFRSVKANDGGYLIGGFTRNYLLNDSSQMFIIKTDSMGISGCHEFAVLPVDSNIAMPYHSANLIQSSGLILDTIILTRTQPAPLNDDACIFLSTQSSVNAQKEFIIYPNPFTNHLEINLDKIESKITITDLLGHLVFSKTSNSDILSIDTRDYKTGVYIISITSLDNSLTRQLIVKE